MIDKKSSDITESSLLPGSGYSLVTPYEEESLGGFVIPESEKEKEQQAKGKVVKTNTDPYLSEYGAKIPYPETLDVGDIIIHRKWGHEDIRWQGKKYRLVKHADIVAIVKKQL